MAIELKELKERFDKLFKEIEIKIQKATTAEEIACAEEELDALKTIYRIYTNHSDIMEKLS